MTNKTEEGLAEMFRYIGYGLFWFFVFVGMGSCTLIGDLDPYNHNKNNQKQESVTK